MTTSDTPVTTTSSLPIACTLTDEERQDRGGQVGALFVHIVAVRELPDGYGFAFPAAAEVARAVFDLMLAERACCPFFTFELAFPSPHERLWLHLRGGQDAKEFVRGSFLLHAPAGAASE